MSFDIKEKFEKDQKTNKRFELLLHNSLLPTSTKLKKKISASNQSFFNEGFRNHITHEVAFRDKRLIELVKTKHGTTCIVCELNFGLTYGLHGEGFIEIHHLNPISTGKRKTSITDLSPVCPNCHRQPIFGST